jgi:hypothetical protein
MGCMPYVVARSKVELELCTVKGILLFLCWLYC